MGGKEEKKLQKTEYLENEKSLFNEIWNIFYRFWRAIIWWKNKNFIKNNGHKNKELKIKKSRYSQKY